MPTEITFTVQVGRMTSGTWWAHSDAAQISLNNGSHVGLLKDVFERIEHLRNKLELEKVRVVLVSAD